MKYAVVIASMLIWAAPAVGQSTTNCSPMRDGSVQCNTYTMRPPPDLPVREPGLDPMEVSKMFTDQMSQQQQRRENLMNQREAIQGIMAIENQRLQIERQKLEIELLRRQLETE